MNENAKKFLEELDTNKKAQELLEAASLDSFEENALALAKVARETGYEVSDEEMLEFLAAFTEQQAAVNDVVADEIRELDATELDAVAGGGERRACCDTYKANENCLLNDACAKVRNIYVPSGFTGTCDSYVYCSGFAYKSDCSSGRLGF